MTNDEKLAKYDEKIKQLKAKKRALMARDKKKAKAARTKRLIDIGAEVEHYAGYEISDLAAFKAYLEKYAYAIAKTQPTQPTHQNDNE